MEKFYFNILYSLQVRGITLQASLEPWMDMSDSSQPFKLVDSIPILDSVYLSSSSFKNFRNGVAIHMLSLKTKFTFVRWFTHSFPQTNEWERI